MLELWGKWGLATSWRMGGGEVRGEGRYHSRQKRKVICSSAFFCGSVSEGAGEADMVDRGKDAVGLNGRGCCG